MLIYGTWPITTKIPSTAGQSVGQSVGQTTPMDGVNPSHQAHTSAPYAQIKTKYSRKPQPRVSSEVQGTHAPCSLRRSTSLSSSPIEPNESKDSNIAFPGFGCGLTATAYVWAHRPVPSRLCPGKRSAYFRCLSWQDNSTFIPGALVIHAELAADMKRSGLQ